MVLKASKNASVVSLKRRSPIQNAVPKSVSISQNYMSSDNVQVIDPIATNRFIHSNVSKYVVLSLMYVVKLVSNSNTRKNVENVVNSVNNSNILHNNALLNYMISIFSNIDAII